MFLVLVLKKYNSKIFADTDGRKAIKELVTEILGMESLNTNCTQKLF